MNKFANMGKEELRAACRTAGISYGKLNNDGMRAALEAKAAARTGTPTLLDLASDEAAKAPKLSGAALGIGKPNAIERGAATESKPKKAKKEPSVRKVRAAANGVTMPSSGTICGAIWAALDAKRAELKETPTFEHLRELAKVNGWQKNTAMTQYQRWKQFYGLMPRSMGGANDAGTV